MRNIRTLEQNAAQDRNFADNGHFAEIERMGYEHGKRREEHEAKKQGIIEEFGWDSEELKAWYAEKEAMKDPLTNGEYKAYRAFEYSLEKGNRDFELEDFLWDREVADFIGTLRRAGIEEFIYSNQSTAVMENIHGFIAEGCTLEGACTFKRTDRRWGEEEETTVLGLRFKVN